MDRVWDWLLGLEGLEFEPGAESELLWAWLPPIWVLVLVFGGAIIAAFSYTYVRERAEAGGLARTFLGVLRVLVAVIVLIMLIGPSLRITTKKQVRQYFIVMIDQSLSMNKTDRPVDEAQIRTLARLAGVPDPDNLTPDERAQVRRLTRHEIVRLILSHPDLRFVPQLEEQALVAWFAFGGGAARIPRQEDLATLAPDGTETAIGEALRQALDQLKGHSIGAVFVLSDGRNNSGQDPVAVADELGRRLIPVYTIPPGYARDPVDIEVRDLQAPEAIVVGDQLSVKFMVVSEGLAGQTTAAEAFLSRALEGDALPSTPEEFEERIRNGQRMEGTDLTLAAGRQPQDVEFVIEPREQGLYHLIVRVPPREDEITPENNYRALRLLVADNRVRILYLDHRPRWEFRFLRNAFIREERFLVQTLLTSADMEYPQPASPTLAPLREFPRDLRTLVDNYDVIVLGDIPLSVLGGNDAAQMIHDFVYEHGGGLILQSGRFWNPRSYADTPLEPLVPAVVRSESTLPNYTNPVHYLLEPDGETHPITRWADARGEAQNRRIWTSGNEGGDGLPPLIVYFPVERLKPAAIPLVSIRDPLRPAQQHPLFAYMHFGRGRVFLSLTDETWRWRYLRGDYPYFYPFWERAVYWTRQGKLMGVLRTRIEVFRGEYVVGERVDIVASAWDQELRPVAAERLVIYAEPPGGERIEVELQADPSTPGHFTGHLIPDQTGEYRLWAEGDDLEQRHYTRFRVFIPNREEQNPIIDRVTLRGMAAATAAAGGREVALHELEDFLPTVRSVDQHTNEYQNRDLWNAPIVFLAIAILLTTEWVVRKTLRML